MWTISDLNPPGRSVASVVAKASGTQYHPSNPRDGFKYQTTLLPAKHVRGGAKALQTMKIQPDLLVNTCQFSIGGGYWGVGWIQFGGLGQ